MDCIKCSNKLTFNLKFKIPYACPSCGQKYRQKDTILLALLGIFFPVVMTIIGDDLRGNTSMMVLLFIALALVLFWYKLVEFYCLNRALYEPILQDDTDKN